MSVTKGGGAMTDRPAAGPSPYGGWRPAVNRRLWQAFIVTMGRVVVALERAIGGRGYGARLAQSAAGVLCRLLGVRVELRGLERLRRHGGGLLAPNHRSAFDIAAMLVAVPGVRFAAKKELFDDPAIRAPMRALGMIPVDREHPDEAKRALDATAARLGRSANLVMFPEGEIAPRDRMQPFRSGAFVLAIQTGMPVFPVAIHNSAGVMPDDGGRITILGGRVVVEILEPIPTEGRSIEDRTTIKELTRKMVAEALRPIDGGVAERRDLGSFAHRAWGVRRRGV